MTVLTLGLLPIMSGRQLIRALRHGSTKDYCYHLIVFTSKRSYRRTRDQKHRIAAHPKHNTALLISDVGAKRRDRHFGLLHEQVGCTLEILNLNLNDYVEVPRSNLMSEDKQGKMGRRKCMNSCLTPHASLRHTKTFPSTERSHWGRHWTKTTVSSVQPNNMQSLLQTSFSLE